MLVMLAHETVSDHRIASGGIKQAGEGVSVYQGINHCGAGASPA